MIQIPVHNVEGQQVDTLQVDEQLLGGEIRPDLLKQAYVRYHANRRQGTFKTKNRGEISYSTRKLYKQKGTGNARRGAFGTNLMRHGAHGHSKKPHSFRRDMPIKMRRLANRNALLAKAVDGEIRIIDRFSFEKPSTRQFTSLLGNLKIDNTCLLALEHTHDHTAASAGNVEHISITRVDQINVFDLLNHRYLLVEKQAFENYLARAKTLATKGAKEGA